jgi:hypothetical protein
MPHAWKEAAGRDCSPRRNPLDALAMLWDMAAYERHGGRTRLRSRNAGRNRPFRCPG